MYVAVGHVASSQIPPGSPSIDGPQVIVLNSQITLLCTSPRGSPTPTVKWFKDDIEITTGVSTTTAGTAVTTSLTFTATLDDHLEVVECQAENGVLINPLTTTKYIEVHFSPQSPTLTGPTTLTLGQTSTWTCISADGYPAGVMTMRNKNKNTQFTSEFTSTSVLDQKSYDVTGTLTWSPVIVNNGDTICCDVTHTTTLGNIPQTVCRQITVAQPIAINAPVTQYSPILQSSVTLQCDVNQGTASHIIWIKDNVQLNIGSNSRLSGGTVATESLTIANVQQSDGGNYHCRGIDAVTGNIVNTDTINVSPVGTPPVTSIPQPSYNQITGQQIILGCTVNSPNSPLQDVQWTFTNNGGQVTDPILVYTSNGKYSGSSVNSPSLTINNVASTDEGTYSCKARNLVGTSTKNPTTSLTLTGRTPPVTSIPQPSYNQITGQQIILGCTVNSPNSPLQDVQWTFTNNGGQVTDPILVYTSNGKYSGSSVNSPSLTINNVASTDEGTYSCKARNLVGTSTKNPTTSLTVTGNLPVVQINPSTYTLTYGGQVVINCGSSPEAIINTLWLNNSVHFGLRGVTEHYKLRWGDITLNTASDGTRYLELNERQTKSRPGENVNDIREVSPKIYECKGERDPVALYENFASKRPSGMSNENDPFYIAKRTIPLTGAENEPWFIRQRLGSKKLASIMKIMKEKGNLDGNNRLTNHSACKYLVHKLKDNNVQDTDIMQISGHKNVQSVRNYSALNEDKHKQISTVLSNTTGLLSVFVTPQNQNVMQGNQQRITCTVSGTSSAQNIAWLFTASGSSQQTQINTANSKKYTLGTTQDPFLTVLNFQPSDAGTYVCRATNAGGSTSSNPGSILTYINEDEDNIIIYVVIGIVAVLVLVVLLIVTIWCRRGREKRKDNASNKNVSQQAAVSNKQDNADYTKHRDSDRDYDGLDPNRQEMHVYNTSQDNVEYSHYSTIPADHIFLDQDHTNLKRVNTYLEPDHTILKPDNTYLEPGQIYFEPISRNSMTSTT
ncbi:unnamed protein product [Mytilus coruscus]|uniref:Ig-like domain-containing protein n=1 Tax=Mytilus coruscus TaxID=42192 RepID=A0A6J8BMF9_MYTCO|nr:unnamed protein product [Mytilus coruscus]